MVELIELWKDDCPDCKKLAPILHELEKEGYEFERHHIDSPEGKKIIFKFVHEIIENSKKLGYDPEYLYTPLVINPLTRSLLSFSDRAPTKKEVIKLAQ